MFEPKNPEAPITKVALVKFWPPGFRLIRHVRAFLQTGPRERARGDCPAMGDESDSGQGRAARIAADAEAAG